MRVLVVDVGGTHAKILVTGQEESRKFPSGPTLTEMLPPGSRAGDNANAFLGGFRLWEQPNDTQNRIICRH